MSHPTILLWVLDRSSCWSPNSALPGSSIRRPTLGGSGGQQSSAWMSSDLKKKSLETQRIHPCLVHEYQPGSSPLSRGYKGRACSCSLSKALIKTQVSTCQPWFFLRTEWRATAAPVCQTTRIHCFFQMTSCYAARTNRQNDKKGCGFTVFWVSCWLCVCVFFAFLYDSRKPKANRSKGSWLLVSSTAL